MEPLATLTREELCDKVWSTPISRLAPTLGLSDVGLAKVCDRHKIPRPPRGYWAKLESGKKVRKPRLPEIKDEQLATVVINPPVQGIGRGTRSVGDKKTDVLAVEVPETVTKPHPLVKATRGAIRRTKPDYRGLVKPPSPPAVDVYISKAQLDRAMCILDALFKAMESRGAQVRVQEANYQKPTEVVIHGERIPIFLTEDYQCVEKELTPAQRKAKEKTPWRFGQPDYVYQTTGRLALRIRTYRYGVRKRWADGKKQRVEDLLGRFIATLCEMAAAERAETEKRMEEQRRRAGWEAERTEMLKLIEQEQAKIDRLLRESDCWHRSKEVRGYVAAVTDHVQRKRGPIEDGSEADLWITWATAQADRMDPLVENPPSVIDEKEKWERSSYYANDVR